MHFTSLRVLIMLTFLFTAMLVVLSLVFFFHKDKSPNVHINILDTEAYKTLPEL